MNLNLIDDAWIPVRRKDGARAVIAPWQMADAALDFPDWPRADLNIACLELLIGLVFLADPPCGVEDWRARQAPDPMRLREKLAPFAPAFNLLGEGPRFMQDLEALERTNDDPNPPDFLFIDSAGGQTTRNNADLTVKRDRYPGLDAPMAAMAIYTLQAHAPVGGAGHRTSMRGGGPMVTVIEPGEGLWSIVWANVPDGAPSNAPVSLDVLPWMRPARVSDQGQQVFAHECSPVEAFFGMPRRLRLITDGQHVTGIAQRNYGADYSGWEHPLTPYYRLKAGSELLPRHPRAGVFGFRNWLGVTAKRADDGKDVSRRAKVLDLWAARVGREVDVFVAGWAMDNMKPLDFVFARAPLIDLDGDATARMEALVEAADKFAAALSGALAVLVAKGEARDIAKEDYFLGTQNRFEEKLRDLQDPAQDWTTIATAWRNDLRAAALAIFDAWAQPGLADRDIKAQGAIVDARHNLTSAFAGYGKLGREAFDRLGLPIPEQGKKKKGKAA